MANVNIKGRTKSKGQFVRLHHDLICSTAWEGLSAQARVVLIQIAKRFNGRNNGTLAASVRDLAHECRISKNTATKAIGELIGAGFIELVKQGAFSLKMRHAAEYRLTWERCDKTGQVGSRAWKRHNAMPTQLNTQYDLDQASVSS